MIDIQFRECCRHCKIAEVRYKFSKEALAILCSHAHVCKDYNTEGTEDPPDVIVKGFHNADG